MSQAQVRRSAFAMRRDYEAGLLIRECAAKHGVTFDTARHRLNSVGTQMRPRGGDHSARHAAA